MTLDQTAIHISTLKNQLQTLLLLGLMGCFCWLLGSWLFGPDMAILTMVIGMAGLVFSPALSTRVLMRAYGAAPLRVDHVPALYRIAASLSERAGLPRAPELHYVPVGTMNAFATGKPEGSAIGLSHGLLQRLTLEELAGVLAHEISHIRYHDTRVMAIADTFGNLTRLLSWSGQFLLFFYLPFMLTGVMQVSLLPILGLILAPTVSALVQLALSRRREYQADLSAAELLGTPEPLIRALVKLDQQKSYWERFYRASSDNSLLRTHPKTSERIEQLQALLPQTDQSEWQVFRSFNPDRIQDPLWQATIKPRRVSRLFWF